MELWWGEGARMGKSDPKRGSNDGKHSASHHVRLVVRKKKYDSQGNRQAEKGKIVLKFATGEKRWPLWGGLKKTETARQGYV